MVAAIGEQILGLTNVWQIGRFQQRCSVVLATQTVGAVSVDGYTLILAVNSGTSCAPATPRPGAPLCLPVSPWHGHRLQLCGAHVRGRQRLRPCTAASWGRTAKIPGTGPAVDVYHLQIVDATLEAGNTTEVDADTTASALLLKHEFLDGGADDVTLATLEKVLRTVGGFELEGYAMTLSAFAWNIVRTYTLTPARRYSFGCRYRLGASNLVMYADNDYVGVTGTFLGTAAQGVWTACLSFANCAELGEDSCQRTHCYPPKALDGHRAGQVQRRELHRRRLWQLTDVRRRRLGR